MAMLTPAEARLYRAQSVVDRRHSVDCALAVRERLGSRATRPVIVASALHDVGKAEAGLGTFGRVFATIAGKLAGPPRVSRWELRDDVLGRVGRYCAHDVRGAGMLMEAGSDPIVVAWAREHHEPVAEWSIDPAVGRVLLEADG